MTITATIQEVPKGSKLESDKPRNPMLVTCRACQHVWPALWLPCDAMLIGKANMKFCPWCGCTKSRNLFIASRSAGDLDRYVAWLETEIARARADAADVPPAGA